MDIRHYISQVEKTYNYRIKTVVPLNDDSMGRIERVILKYQPQNLSDPRRTMFQKNPLDFPTVPGAEVYIVDVELGLPASSFNLAREIKDALGIPDKFVVVRGENDPTELETQALVTKAEMDEVAEKAGMVPGALLDHPTYDESDMKDGAEFYGDTYNKRFLGYLSKVEGERKEKTKRDPVNAPFGWLETPKSDVPQDDGPTIGTEQGTQSDVISGKGNIDGDKRSYSRVYQKQGKTFVKTDAGDPIRKGK
jgi:hypothetical protein